MDGRGDPPLSLRHLNLKKSFKLGILPVLTAFSKEDVQRVFPTHTDAQRERLYDMFIQVIKSLHENIEEEFESICQETEVGRILDTVEQLVEEHKLDVLAADKTDIANIKENISKAKEDEVRYLTSLLLKLEDQNNALKARIESVKTNEDPSTTANVVDQLRTWDGNFQKHHGSWNG